MAGAHEDIVCQVEMTREAYEKLQKLDPKNDILKYAEMAGVGVRYLPEHLEEFFKRFNDGNNETDPIHRDVKYQKILESKTKKVESKKTGLAQKTQKE